jgi:hypothetical protein
MKLDGENGLDLPSRMLALYKGKEKLVGTHKLFIQLDMLAWRVFGAAVG